MRYRGFNAPTSQHVVVGVVCDGVDVRRRLGAAFALVGSNHGGCVDRQPFVWIHRHAEEAGVGLRKPHSVEVAGCASQDVRRRWTHIDHPGRVASPQVVQHGRLVEVRQHGHVLDHVILGRVHLLDVSILYRQGLSVNTRGDISRGRPSCLLPSGKR